MSLQPGAHQELSVRMDYEGASHYFPLGTNIPRVAARRASRIYRSLVSQGWEAANQRFSRELTVAFHWLDVPLAWTYTTIHTLNPAAQAPPGEPLKPAGTRFRAAVVESDGGIRRALEWCVNQMDGLCCVAAFASAEEALRDLRRRPIQLALVGHNLSDRSGAACLEEMKATAPEVAGLLYSVYEDSEELFRRTPGGAGTYLLRRTGPTAFLEPIQAWLKRGPLAGERMTSAAWQYFKDSIDSMPVGGSALQLPSLTQREQEVLGLLSKGHLDKEIADQLGISIYTVHEHVRNIFDKLGTHNRTEAAVKFLQK
jgi:DNA-binding NarL/FixJ family response regulator